MNERLFFLRKEILGLSRAKFGKPIGMTDSEIKNVEKCLTTLREDKIDLICSYYGVNKTWFVNGDGDMFIPKSKVDEIQEIANNAMERTAEDARKSLASHLAKLTDAEAILLAELLERQLKG